MDSAVAFCCSQSFSEKQRSSIVSFSWIEYSKTSAACSVIQDFLNIPAEKNHRTASAVPLIRANDTADPL